MTAQHKVEVPAYVLGIFITTVIDGMENKPLDTLLELSMILGVEPDVHALDKVQNWLKDDFLDLIRLWAGTCPCPSCQKRRDVIDQLTRSLDKTLDPRKD